MDGGARKRPRTRAEPNQRRHGCELSRAVGVEVAGTRVGVELCDGEDQGGVPLAVGEANVGTVVSQHLQDIDVVVLRRQYLRSNADRAELVHDGVARAL